MPHVFLSYVREDKKLVDRLASELKRAGVQVWLDREQIKPGQRWQSAIATAIEEGAFFIACFSKAHEVRSRSYMNEELTLAIEELRQRPSDRAWFIPVLLNESTVPNRRIGAGETLRDIQWVELHKDWDNGLQQLLAVIGPPHMTAEQVIEAIDLPQFDNGAWSALETAFKQVRCTTVIGGHFCPGVVSAIREAVLGYKTGIPSPDQHNEDLALLVDRLYQEYSQRELKEEISRRVGNLSIEVCPNYGRLSALPLALYLTTNYDDLLLRTLKAVGKQPFWGLCPWQDRLSFQWSDGKSGSDPYIEPTVACPVIFHLFGHKEFPESLVLSERDFREFLQSIAREESLIPPRIAAALVKGPVLFIGYHSQDRQLRELLHCLDTLLQRNFTRCRLVVQISPMLEVNWLSTKVPWEQLLSSAKKHFNDISLYYTSMKAHVYWGGVEEFLSELVTRTTA